MHKLYFSLEALKDLDEIWTYMTQELRAPEAAQSTLDKILDKTEALKRFALMGARLSSITAFDSEYRFLVSGNYIVFYRVMKDRVFVDRVLSARRDYMRILFGKSEDIE